MDVTGDLSTDLLVLPCRACTTEQIQSKMYFLYKNPEITEIFMQFSTIQIYEKDGLPTHICEQCNIRLNDLINFRKTCVLSDETFRQKSDIKNEIISKGLKLESVEICEIGSPKKALEPEVKVELEEIMFDDNFNYDDDCDYDETYSPKQEVKPKRAARTKTKKSKISTKKPDTNKKAKERRLHFVCDQCSATFNKKHRIEAHLRQHLGLKPFECKECNVSFRKWASLRLHNNVNHSNGQFKKFNCPYDGCSKSYNLNDSLKVHVRTIHHGVPHRKPKSPFICETCGKSFTVQFTLKEHMYTHTGEAPFPCTQCPKRYSSKYSLKVHLMRHNNIKNHVCTVCEARRTTRKELRIHMETHMKGKQFSCKLCPSVFQTNANLNRHNRMVHRGHKPYSCTYCQQSFAKADTLKHHTMTHTGEKPHACPICDKRFIQPVALRTHLKVHAKQNRLVPTS